MWWAVLVVPVLMFAVPLCLQLVESRWLAIPVRRDRLRAHTVDAVTAGDAQPAEPGPIAA